MHFFKFKNLIDEHIDENNFSKLLKKTFKLNPELIQKSYGLVKLRNNSGYQPSQIQVSNSSKFNKGSWLDIIENSTSSDFPYIIDRQIDQEKCNDNDENNDKK